MILGRATALPNIRTKPTDEKKTLFHVILGTISEVFPDYAKEIKGPPPKTVPQLRIDYFELAIFLLVLKRHEPLKEAKDFFTSELSGWHQRIQGSSLRANFLKRIEMTRREQSVEFYKDAYLEEQLVMLTDFIHNHCLETPPLSDYPPERYAFSEKHS